MIEDFSPTEKENPTETKYFDFAGFLNHEAQSAQREIDKTLCFSLWLSLAAPVGLRLKLRYVIQEEYFYNSRSLLKTKKILTE